MRKIILILAVLCMALTMTGCLGWQSVESGHVGVKVNKFGSEKGVEEKPLGVGVYWVGFTWDIYEYPTFQQNEQWSLSPNEGKKHDQSVTFQCEGMDVNADVGCVYQVRRDMAPALFQRFRLGIDEISDGYLRQLVRNTMNDEASRYKIEQIYGEGRTKFITTVQKIVADEVRPLGLDIHNITIGALRLPGPVLNAINAKIAATQSAIQAENELRKTKAEAAKAVAQAEGDAQALLIAARARAQSNSMIAASLTPLLIERNRVEKWDGRLPQVQGTSTPFVSLTTSKQ